MKLNVEINLFIYLPIRAVQASPSPRVTNEGEDNCLQG